MTTPSRGSDSALARLHCLVRDEHADRKDTGAVRFLHCRFGEIKADGSPETEMRFSGYGAYFGNLDAYGDVIARGAFKRTLREAKSSNQWPAMLLQHGGWGISADDLNPIGIWTELAEDEHGLKAEGLLAPTPRGTEMYTLLKMKPRPAINGLSIGFIAKAWKTATGKDEPRRTLTDVDLVEVSPVTFPANGKARIGAVKSSRPGSVRELESALREVFGFSRREASHAAGAAWRAIAHRDESKSSELAGLLKGSAQRFAKPI